ncbi:NUDIX domain-containing protein [Candidatus Woesearchaeota archaeon]|nr:NUDIX domain-containing protein [Candidatus Woesearchaeota archaeon]
MDISQQILKKLMYNKGMSYNKLRDEVPSNKFAYYLNKLVEEDIVKKNEDIYELTSEGIHLIASIDGVDIVQKKKPIVCTFVLGKDGDKLLMNRRAKQPFLNYVGIPGGKVEFGSRLPEEAARELLEETGMSAEKFELRLITNFRTYDKETNELTHHVIGFFFLATGLSGELKSKDREGENLFMTRDEALKDKVYPDVEFFTAQMLGDGPLEFKEIDRFTSDGEFVGINLLD